MPKDGTSAPETLEDALKVIEDLTAKLTESTKHSREWEERAKANKDAAPLLEKANERIAELEAAQDSGKTEVEKQLAKFEADLKGEREAREAAEKAAATDRLSALRTRIGTDKGVPTHLIDRLRGEDEESIAADADAVLTGLPKPPVVPGVPGQGTQGEPLEEDKTFAAFKAGIAGHLPKEK